MYAQYLWLSLCPPKLCCGSLRWGTLKINVGCSEHKLFQIWLTRMWILNISVLNILPIFCLLCRKCWHLGLVFMKNLFTDFTEPCPTKVCLTKCLLTFSIFNKWDKIFYHSNRSLLSGHSSASNTASRFIQVQQGCGV